MQRPAPQAPRPARKGTEKFELNPSVPFSSDDVYLACAEAVEESVINAMVVAEDMTTLRTAGQVCRAIDHNRLVEMMRRYEKAG